MRTAAVIFFLFLCFGFLEGNTTAHICSHQSPFLEQTPEKLNPGTSYATDANAVFSFNSLSSESAYLTHVDYDDEDEEQTIRKQIFLVKCLVAFSHAFVLYYANKSLEGYPAFCKYLSRVVTPKYIAQRVLRI